MTEMERLAIRKAQEERALRATTTSEQYNRVLARLVQVEAEIESLAMQSAYKGMEVLR